MKKIIFALVAFVLFSSHVMYLKLDSYFLEPNTSASIQLFNGTFAKSENSIDRNRMIDASLVGNGERIKVKETQWTEKESVTLLNFTTGEEGTWIAGISTAPKSIEMDADAFNTYLEHEGILDMLTWRRENNASEEEAVEKYSKHVKTIFQVGDKRSDDWQKVLEYPIEFIPLNNPYDLNTGDSLRVKLLLNGEPLANQLVYANYKALADAHTHEDGEDAKVEHGHSHEDMETSTEHEHTHEDATTEDHGHDDTNEKGHSHAKETEQGHAHEEKDKPTTTHSHENTSHQHSEAETSADEHSHDNASEHSHEEAAEQGHTHEEKDIPTATHSHDITAHQHSEAETTADEHSHDNASEHSHEEAAAHNHEANETEEPHHHTSGQQLRTDANGIVTAKLTADGIWYLQTIHMVNTEEEGFTHESNWTTLTFEVVHGHSEDTHEHEAEEGIPSYLYWIGSFLLVGILFFWFNRKN